MPPRQQKKVPRKLKTHRNKLPTRHGLGRALSNPVKIATTRNRKKAQSQPASHVDGQVVGVAVSRLDQPKSGTRHIGG
jgi:hypothetical protein